MMSCVGLSHVGNRPEARAAVQTVGLLRDEDVRGTGPPAAPASIQQKGRWAVLVNSPNR